MADAIIRIGREYPFKSTRDTDHFQIEMGGKLRANLPCPSNVVQNFMVIVYSLVDYLSEQGIKDYDIVDGTLINVSKRVGQKGPEFVRDLSNQIDAEFARRAVE